MRDLPRPHCQPNQTYCTAGESLLTELWARAQACHQNRKKNKNHFDLWFWSKAKSHSGASHSHTMYVISSAVKHCNSKLTSLLPARNTLQIKNGHMLPQAWFGCCCFWKQHLFFLLIYCDETVQFMQFVLECSLAIEYKQLKMASFPHENVQSIQFVDVSSVPECCLQGITFNQKKLHTVDNKSW